MIVRIQTGTSFMGAGLYYLHDKMRDGEQERLTTERVAWTHTLNTLEEEPQGVLAEMDQTARNQAMLRQQARGRADGRPTGKPVMTVALSWAPEQQPSQKEMVDAGRSFLEGMGWQEHQVLFVGHDDTKHSHVHLIINRVHPETGMTLDDTWARYRSQRWALAYEREQGRVLCQSREAIYEGDRTAPRSHMNYREWQAWQELAKESLINPILRREFETGEWQALKYAQRQERAAFWKETAEMRSELRSAVREEVRAEFAGEWQSYARSKEERMQAARAHDREVRKAIQAYQRQGGMAAIHAIAELKEGQRTYHAERRVELAEMRAEIATRQGDRFEALAAPSLEALSKQRAEAYKDVLARQRDERDELRDDQKQGVRRYDLLTAYSPAAPSAEKPREPERSKATTHKSADQQDGALERRGTARATFGHSEKREASRPMSWQGAANVELHVKSPRRDAADLVAGAGIAFVGRVAESLTSLFDAPASSNQEPEKATALAQEEELDSRRQTESAPTANESEEQARKRARLEFYLEQRAREREWDEDRDR